MHYTSIPNIHISKGFRRFAHPEALKFCFLFRDSFRICCRDKGQPSPVMLTIDCAIATENIWLEAEPPVLGAVMPHPVTD